MCVCVCVCVCVTCTRTPANHELRKKQRFLCVQLLQKERRRETFVQKCLHVGNFVLMYATCVYMCVYIVHVFVLQVCICAYEFVL